MNIRETVSPIKLNEERIKYKAKSEQLEKENDKLRILSSRAFIGWLMNNGKDDDELWQLHQKFLKEQEK